MRHKRPGVGPAGHQLQHRRLDFDESAGVQRFAQGPHDGGPRAYRFAGLRTDDEVDVPLAYPRLLAHRLVRHG